MALKVLVILLVLLLPNVLFSQQSCDPSLWPLLGRAYPRINTYDVSGLNCRRIDNIDRVKVNVYFYCYDPITLEPISGCYISAQNFSCENSGHHEHDGSRPTGIYDPPAGFVGNDPNYPLYFKTTYIPPEVSGRELVWMCCNCPGYIPTCGYADFPLVEIKVPGLVPLPESEYYVIYDPSGPNIPELVKVHGRVDHYIRPEYTDDIEKIAKWVYETFDGRRLMINDVSLPWGGLLDFKNPWQEPHCGHREGEHVDIRFWVKKRDGTLERFFGDPKRRKDLKEFAIKHTVFVAEEHPLNRPNHFHLRPERR